MATARVTTVSNTKHLILSNCPICDHAHDTILRIAEVKVRVKDDYYPYWTDCPHSPLDVLLIRFVNTKNEDGTDKVDIGMVSLHRDDPLFLIKPPE